MAAVAGFEPHAAEEDLFLTVHPPAEPVRAHADPDRVGQIVANLVENALKYAGLGVSVSTGTVGDHAWLVVADDGPGIAPDDLAHVFERLYVVRRRPRRKESGSGLGLAIVRELTEAMDGRVEAVAAPEGGTEMRVWLPLARSSSANQPDVS